MALRRGLSFYRDIHDNKPPALYFLASVARSVPVFRIILFLWNSVSVYFFYLISKKLFKSPFLYKFSAVLFTILSTIPLLEGQISNGEIFMIMPAIVAIYLVLSKSKKFFLIGLLFSLSFLFKVPIAFDFLALMLYFTFFQANSFKSLLSKLFSKKVIFILLFFTIPIIISILYYCLIGAGSAYVKAALMQNVGYLSSWEGYHLPFYKSGLIQRFFFLSVILGLLFAYRNRLNKKFLFFYIYFTTALFGSLLSGRPYPHYLIQLLPAFVILFALLLSSKSKLVDRLIIIFLFFVTTISLFKYKFWYYPSLSYYKNFLKYSLRLQNKEDYWNYWGSYVAYNYQTGQYIHQHTNKKDKIFVWGTEPSIYLISKRLPLGKYTVAYHIKDFHASTSTINKIKARLPKYIIYIKGQHPSFPQLDSFVNTYYSFQQVFGNNLIFELR